MIKRTSDRDPENKIFATLEDLNEDLYCTSSPEYRNQVISALTNSKEPFSIQNGPEIETYTWIQ